MELNASDFLTQAAATIAGGIVLFFLGLLVSWLSKRTSAYKTWIARYWPLIGAIAIIFFVAYRAFDATRSLAYALLPIIPAVAILTIAVTILNTRDEQAHRARHQALEYAQSVKADLLLHKVEHWDSKEVPENVLDECCDAIWAAPVNYQGSSAALDIIEKTLTQMRTENQSISGFVLARLHDTLPRLQRAHAAQVDRLLKLLAALSVQ